MQILAYTLLTWNDVEDDNKHDGDDDGDAQHHQQALDDVPEHLTRPEDVGAARVVARIGLQGIPAHVLGVVALGEEKTALVRYKIPSGKTAKGHKKKVTEKITTTI